MTTSRPVYEVRPRKDWHGFDLVGHQVPSGRLGFEGPDAFVNAAITRSLARARTPRSFAYSMNPAPWSGQLNRLGPLASSIG
jgi:hypothetical protein